ncbi:hypothetical protein A2U01_0099614, partial [Trifolium medium]|nr:hypothetical protein [Trifolium medium]
SEESKVVVVVGDTDEETDDSAYIWFVFVLNSFV